MVFVFNKILYLEINYLYMWQSLWQLLFPKTCLHCESLLLKSETCLCTTCTFDLPFTYHYKRPLNETFTTFYGKVPVEFGASILYFYEKGITQSLIHHLKYKNKPEIGIYLGKLQLDEIRNLCTNNGITEIVPVPLHSKRFKQRKYNQLDRFGELLSQELQLPYSPNLLIRNKYRTTQTFKNKEERQFKTKNDFELSLQTERKSPHFLLIDDVLTTGSTLIKCSNELLKIPNAKVSILTMAYTV